MGKKNHPALSTSWPSSLLAPGTWAPEHLCSVSQITNTLCFLHLILGSPVKVKVEIGSLGLVRCCVYLHRPLGRWSPRPLAHPRQDGLRPFHRERLDYILRPSLSPTLPSCSGAAQPSRNSTPPPHPTLRFPSQESKMTSLRFWNSKIKQE